MNTLETLAPDSLHVTCSTYCVDVGKWWTRCIVIRSVMTARNHLIVVWMYVMHTVLSLHHHLVPFTTFIAVVVVLAFLLFVAIVCIMFILLAISPCFKK